MLRNYTFGLHLARRILNIRRHFVLLFISAPVLKGHQPEIATEGELTSAKRNSLRIEKIVKNPYLMITWVSGRDPRFFKIGDENLLYCLIILEFSVIWHLSIFVYIYDAMQYHRCGITGPSAPVRLATRVTHSPTVSSPGTDEVAFQCRLLSTAICSNFIRNKHLTRTCKSYYFTNTNQVLKNSCKIF